MRFPTGIRKIIELYSDQILSAISGWVDWAHPLGCAHFGCVWEIWSQDPAYDMVPNLARPTGRVLKLSTDPTEGPVIAAIMKTGLDAQLDGLTRWYGVWRIPEPVSRRHSRSIGWVIIREEIRPLRTVDNDAEAPQNIHWLDLLANYNRAAYRMLHLKMKEKVAIATLEADEALRRLFDYPETYYIAQALEALAREGIILVDVHPGNLGFRIRPSETKEIIPVWWSDGVSRPPLLIFDPGHSRAPETPIADLPGY
jgi:hypothetical protein